MFLIRQKNNICNMERKIQNFFNQNLNYFISHQNKEFEILF